MTEFARVTDIGHGECYAGHDDVPEGEPKEFVTTFVTGAATVFMNNKPVALVGSVGYTDCGHTTTALTGSNTVFVEGKAIHQKGDIGTINEGDGVYHCVSASPDVGTN